MAMGGSSFCGCTGVIWRSKFTWKFWFWILCTSWYKFVFCNPTMLGCSCLDCFRYDYKLWYFSSGFDKVFMLIWFICWPYFKLACISCADRIMLSMFFCFLAGSIPFIGWIILFFIWGISFRTCCWFVKSPFWQKFRFGVLPRDFKLSWWEPKDCNSSYLFLFKLIWVCYLFSFLGGYTGWSSDI